MTRLTDFNKQCIYDCYNLMRDCIDFEHIEDSEFICTTFRSIQQYRIALPPELYKHINDFVTYTLHPIVNDPNFFSATKLPEYGSFNKDGSFEINSEDSLKKIIAIMFQICSDMEYKVDSFTKQYMRPYLN